MGNDIFQNVNSELEQWIVNSIDKGISPNKLLQDIFSIIDKKLKLDNSNEYKQVLYCDMYGGFYYKQEFKDFVRLHFNVRLNSNHREVYDYIEAYAQFLNISIEEVLEKLSTPYFKLYLYHVPKHRAYRIISHNASEYVEILREFFNEI
jgi:hypothetical protein